jgi:hypothetical protein
VPGGEGCAFGDFIDRGAALPRVPGRRLARGERAVAGADGVGGDFGVDVAAATVPPQVDRQSAVADRAQPRSEGKTRPPPPSSHQMGAMDAKPIAWGHSLHLSRRRCRPGRGTQLRGVDDLGLARCSVGSVIGIVGSFDRVDALENVLRGYLGLPPIPDTIRPPAASYGGARSRSFPPNSLSHPRMLDSFTSTRT